MNNSVLINTIFYLMMNNKTNLPEENSYNYYYLNIGKGMDGNFIFIFCQRRHLTLGFFLFFFFTEMNSTKCYGIYGCFDLSPPWTSEHRPVSLFPEGLKKVPVKLTFPIARK